MNIDLIDLRKKALDATPGPWLWALTPADRDGGEWLAECYAKGRHRRCWMVAVPDGENRVEDKAIIPAVTGNGPMAEANSAFIAAANPAVVLELLDEIERLRAEATIDRSPPTEDDKRWAQGVVSDRLGEASAEISRLRAELDSEREIRVQAAEASVAAINYLQSELDGGIRKSTLERLGELYAVMEIGPVGMLDRPKPAECEGRIVAWLWDVTADRAWCGWADEWDAALNAALDAAGAPKP